MILREERRKQVADQCRAVQRLSAVMARLHGDYAKMFKAGHSDQLIELVGERTARFMETLGDMLNGMDAICEEDRWMDPIYEEAHRLWPSGGVCSHCRVPEAEALAAAREAGRREERRDWNGIGHTGRETP